MHERDCTGIHLKVSTPHGRDGRGEDLAAEVVDIVLDVLVDPLSRLDKCLRGVSIVLHSSTCYILVCLICVV